ncbi:Alpha/Beta hydrolase protein [Flammula alnicola]|nr:Alpha/Beta hydrolase protein [Flammula alnicola]
MPQVKIHSQAGSALINYTIATPTSENAESIDPSLPTVLLLHPIYVSQVIFHHQFASPNVRRFNLVALDARCHGDTIGAVPSTYRRVDAADDVFKFMEALKLPPCHFFGVSLGSCVALQMAVSHPDKVLSLFMISPLPLVEPELVAAGRQEIYDCWVEGCKNPNQPDETALLDYIFGAVQFGFNRSSESIVNAMVQYTLPRALRIWSPEHFDELHTVSVKFFLDRQPHPTSDLKRINCPVHLIHCSEDIAYPLYFMEEIRDSMAKAGLEVRLSQVPDAPHFGCVTHPEAYAAFPMKIFLFHEWMMDHVCGVIPPAKASVISPYETDLINAGYKVNEQSDSDDDLLHVVP